MSQIVRTLVRTNPRVYQQVITQRCVLPQQLKHLCNEGCIVRQTPHVPRCIISKSDSCAAVCNTDVVVNCACKPKREVSSSNKVVQHC